MMIDNLCVFDCEVFAYDWIFIFKNSDGEYFIFHNDNDAVKEFMNNSPLLVGYNNKSYDQFILKAVLLDMNPEEIKQINDMLIVQGMNGWQIPVIAENKVYFQQFDLMDDTQQGTGLKDIEGHLGMNIQESSVDFNLNRSLTDTELAEVIEYCKHDVDATEILYRLRKVYINTKLTLGQEKGLGVAKTLYMTNAKLTAAYLDAVKQEHNDEREYVFPADILWQYIPAEVLEFFERIHDKSIPDDDLWKQSVTVSVGECITKLGWGGIHGAIPTYREETTDSRVIKNADVASYYPHLITIGNYGSRNIPSAKIYEDLLTRRMNAKKNGDKGLATALKLVANTTYGATLNQYNDLYDPLMARSVCVTGQLRLLELANHLLSECPTLKVIQLNTDGIMCSFDVSDTEKWDSILKEWQLRTHFELEEDVIKLICQKDVNNYIEQATNGELKIKGGMLVRGVLTNDNIDFTAMGFPQWENLSGSAFKINNNAVVIPRAMIEYLVNGVPIEDTINACDNIFDFQIIAKTWAKSGNAYHALNGELQRIQRVNRVYAALDYKQGTLYQIDPNTNNYRLVSGLPAHLVVDNDNKLTIDVVDKDWYIRLAKRQVNDFLGIKLKRDGNRTRRINKIKKDLLLMLEVSNG